MDQEQLRYPTGRFVKPVEYTAETKANCLRKLKALPGKLRQATYNLNEQQLDTAYRKDGWSTREIVHHLADSHMNSLVRFKLALTEDVPTIKPYDQASWVQGPDARLPISTSLSILDGVHARLSHLIEHMTEEDHARKLYHPEMEKQLELRHMMAIYAWHGHHHLTQITELKQRQGW